MKRPQLLVCAGLALVAVSPAIADDGEDCDGATMRIVEMLIRFDSCSLVAVAEAAEVVVEAAPEPKCRVVRISAEYRQQWRQLSQDDDADGDDDAPQPCDAS